MTNEYIEGMREEELEDILREFATDFNSCVEPEERRDCLFNVLKKLETALTDTWNKAREEAYAELRGKVKSLDAYAHDLAIRRIDILSLLTPNQEKI